MLDLVAAAEVAHLRTAQKSSRKTDRKDQRQGAFCTDHRRPHGRNAFQPPSTRILQGGSRTGHATRNT